MSKCLNAFTDTVYTFSLEPLYPIIRNKKTNQVYTLNQDL